MFCTNNKNIASRFLLQKSYFTITGKNFENIDPDSEFYLSLTEKINSSKVKANWPQGDLLFTDEGQFKTIYDDWLPMYKETLTIYTLMKDLMAEKYYEVLANIVQIYKNNGNTFPEGLTALTKSLIKQIYEITLLRMCTQVSKQLNFIMLPDKGQKVDQKVLEDTNV